MQQNDQPDADAPIPLEPPEAKIDLSLAIARVVNAMDRYHYAKDFGSSEAVLNMLRTEVEQALKVFDIAYSCTRQGGPFVG
jgi:hypothetical protein